MVGLGEGEVEETGEKLGKAVVMQW